MSQKEEKVQKSTIEDDDFLTRGESRFLRFVLNVNVGNFKSFKLIVFFPRGGSQNLNCPNFKSVSIRYEGVIKFQIFPKFKKVHVGGERILWTYSTLCDIFLFSRIPLVTLF